jgi:hypothetical protein
MPLKFRLIEEVNDFGSTLTTEYEGFTHQITKANIKDYIFVIAWLDGEQDYWIVDGEAGIAELSRHYMDMVGIVPEFMRMRYEDVPRRS